MLPDIYFFNPTCEPAMANGSPYYTAPALLRKFEADLGYLPGWLADVDDQVLVQGTVDPEYSDRMKALGFRLPGYVNLSEALSDTEWLSMSKNRLRPWGWSPAVYNQFKNVLASCSEDFRQSAVAQWKADHKILYSRLSAIGMLKKLLEEKSAGWLPGFTEIPVVCTSLRGVEEALEKSGKAVVKSPWSSSGRGLLFFPNVDTKKKNDELVSGMLNQQGFVTVEPWLDKVSDLSYQFVSSAGKISFQGRTVFETDGKGRYVRNFLTDNLNATSEVREFIEARNAGVASMLIAALSRSGYSKIYEGWIGIDALIYRSAEGRLKFHPLIEINGRYTMGAVAMKMREYLAPGSHGFMQLFYSKAGNFRTYCQKQEATMPLVMENRKIVSGFMPLTPPLPEHHFGAYIEMKTQPFNN